MKTQRHRGHGGSRQVFSALDIAIHLGDKLDGCNGGCPADLHDEPLSAMVLHTLRRDGFMSVRPRGDWARMLSKPFSLRAAQITASSDARQRRREGAVTLRLGLDLRRDVETDGQRAGRRLRR